MVKFQTYVENQETDLDRFVTNNIEFINQHTNETNSSMINNVNDSFEKEKKRIFYALSFKSPPFTEQKELNGKEIYFNFELLKSHCSDLYENFKEYCDNKFTNVVSIKEFRDIVISNEDNIYREMFLENCKKAH